MVTVFIADNKEKIKEILLEAINKEGNTQINISKQENIIKVLTNDDIRGMVLLSDKVIELGAELYNLKKGALYRSVLEAIEKPLFEYVLERTEGNQLKASRILGINRNTMRAKIRKLGINTNMYKE